MLLARRQESINLNPLMLTLRSESSGGQFGRLGMEVPTALMWIGAGVFALGLGWSIYDTIKAASEKTGAKAGDFSTEDLSKIAGAMAKQDPRGRSAEEWMGGLTAMLGPGGSLTPTPQLCPTGFYRDPATGACLPVQKAGFFEDLGTGGMIALGVGGLVLAKVLKLI